VTLELRIAAQSLIFRMVRKILLQFKLLPFGILMAAFLLVADRLSSALTQIEAASTLEALQVRVGGQVAQLVEHRTENPSVGGSNPPLTTMKLKDLRRRTKF
jgi:hypothetical protein